MWYSTQALRSGAYKKEAAANRQANIEKAKTQQAEREDIKAGPLTKQDVAKRMTDREQKDGGDSAKQEMKKKSGPHCLVSDQPLNFDLSLHHTSYIIVEKFIKLVAWNFTLKNICGKMGKWRPN